MGDTKKAKSTALSIAPPISWTVEQFHRLKKVPKTVEWLHNFTNARTRRGYVLRAVEAQVFGKPEE